MGSSVLSKRASVVAALVACGLLLMTVLTPQGAYAHERVTRGNYLFVIGWADEPPLVGIKNGLDLGIFNVSTGKPVPVSNAERNLTAKFLYGSAKPFAVDLVPVFNSTSGSIKAGFYRADIIPSAAGTYSVNLTGRVEKQRVNFTQAIDPVGWPSSLEYPNPRPTVENISNQVSGAQQVAIYALALGAGGLILGATGLGVALISRRRHGQG